MQNIEKYIYQILPAISFLALFQSTIDLGESLSLIISYYSKIRDLIFKPLEWVDLNLNVRTKNLLAFYTLISFAFAFRGKLSNRIALLGFVGGIIASIIAAIILTIMAYLGVFGLLDKVEVSKDPSIIETIGYIFFILVLFALSTPFMMLFFWSIALVTPFIITFSYKIPFIGRSIEEYCVDLIEWTLDSFEWLYFKIFPNYLSLLTEIDSSIYKEFWSGKEYIEYYKPLFDMLKLALFFLLVCKLIVDTFY